VASRTLTNVSVTPQTNEPEVPDGLAAISDDAASVTPSLFDRPQPVRNPEIPDASAVVTRDSDPLPASLFDRPGHAGDLDGPLITPARPVPVVEPITDDVSPQFEARLVKRLVRHISPWSVLKVSTLLYLSMYVVFLLAGTGLWMLASNRGLIGSFESFMDELLAEENFQIDGSHVFRLAAMIGVVGVVVASALTVLFSIIFNLISDITGGVRFSVVELETARPRRRRFRR
jgi:hypothetical protein